MLRLREIKNKVIVTQNISDITRAIGLVSAIKMKKAQKLALGSRPFTEKVLDILKELTKYKERIKKSFYFKKRKVRKSLAVVVASDKGFSGAFNKNILNFAEEEIEKMKFGVEIFAIGKKAIKFFKRKNYKLLVEFSGIGDYGEFEKVKPIADKLIDYFKENRFQKIILFYTDFISSFLQKPIKIQILPIDLKMVEEIFREYQLKKREKEIPLEKRGYFLLLEPSPREIFEGLVPQLVRYLIYHSILEANASEHSARMLAMERASQNAKEIMKELILEFNKVRQAKITSEVCEITTAKEALV